MSIYDLRDSDDAVNQVESVTLSPGQKATVTFKLSQTRSRFFLEQLAVSQYVESTYEVELDGTGEYGPAAVPPTELNDNSDTFTPPESFQNKVTVVVENLSGSATRTYHIRVKGWHRPSVPGTGGL